MSSNIKSKDSLFPSQLDEIEGFTELIREQPNEELAGSNAAAAIHAPGVLEDSPEDSPMDDAAGAVMPEAGNGSANEAPVADGEPEVLTRAIYGVDDRVDLHQIVDQRLRNDAETVVAVFSAASVRDNHNGTSTLVTQPLGAKYALCPKEPFLTQPTIIPSAGSGVLVGRDVVATAAHVLDRSANNPRFVFGFALEKSGVPPEPFTVNNDQIYTMTATLHRVYDRATGEDWALVRLNRPVLNRRIASVRRSGKIADGQPLHVIGHPIGLPLKIAGGARVTGNSPARFFFADLDIYSGNSGSPVFNSITHEVEGLCVREEGTFGDFVKAGDCWKSTVWPQDGSGVEINRATQFAALLGPGWQELDDNPATTAIAAGPTAASGAGLYQLHNSGALWRYNGTPMVGWELLDNNAATVEIATDGVNLYQRHEGTGSIWRYTGNWLAPWEQLGGNPLTVAITATTGGRLYQLQSNGLLSRYTGPPLTGWKLLDNNAATVTIAADGDQLYQLHEKSGAIWRYTGNAISPWQQVGGNPRTKAILAAAGELYQLQDDGLIWRYTSPPISGWELLDNNTKTVALAHDGTSLYQLHNTGAVWRYTGVPLEGWAQLDDHPDTKAIVGAGGQLYTRTRRVTTTGKVISASIRRLVG